MRYFIILLSLLSLSITHAQSPKRQMRGVWIASVANIDFPSQKNLSTEEQKQELITLLDKFQENNINTVIFQVRPSADALYESAIEPWSEYLTGKQGVAPNPYYDPLQFLIDEARTRCMEVHVWLNPYRVLNSSEVQTLSPQSIYNREKNWVLQYDNKYYINPGIEEARHYLIKVVKEIVEKYDIDAVHFDDYFYPYPIKGQAFPDASTFQNNPREFNNIEDWRRDNVTQTIKEIRQAIKEIKPWVDFGISPFGVWRNKEKDPLGSNTTRALTNYDDLYADIRLWLEKGYIDYVVPQLYWEIGMENVCYTILSDWWAKNSFGRNLYIGLYASGMSVNTREAWKNPNELVRQMRYSKQIKEIEGEMFFSAKYFVQNIQGLNDSLKTLYPNPALPPVNRNISTTAPKPPKRVKFGQVKKQLILLWDKVTDQGGKQTAFYVVYAFKGTKPGDFNDSKNIVAFTRDNSIDLTQFVQNLSGHYTFTVTTINKYRRESKAADFVKRKF